jgi:hypothetical protein
MTIPTSHTAAMLSVLFTLGGRPPDKENDDVG